MDSIKPFRRLTCIDRIIAMRAQARSHAMREVGATSNDTRIRNTLAIAIAVAEQAVRDAGCDVINYKRSDV